MEHRLAELSIPDYMSLQDRYKIIDSTLTEYKAGLPSDEPLHIAGPLRNAIDRCFQPDTIEEILQNLEIEAARGESRSESPLTPDQRIEYQAQWAMKSLEAIRGRSPTSLKVTLRQMQYGREWSIREAFEREHQIASHFMEHPDFVEGVSARLLRKPPTKPQWQPDTLEGVTEQSAEGYFLKPAGQRMTFLKDEPIADYYRYPHQWLALPKEDEVKAYVHEQRQNARACTKVDVLQHFLQRQTGKLGVKEVLEDIMERQLVVEQDRLSWRSD